MSSNLLIFLVALIGAHKLCRNLQKVFFIAGGCLFFSPAWAGPWVTGYFPGWEQDGMAASNIDFTTITHVVHFSLTPLSDGSLDSGENGLTPDKCSNLVAVAHAAGAKAIICVGGAGTESVFQEATTAANLPAFVSNLVNFVNLYGYDGLDIDWEPFLSTDANQYTNLVDALRSAAGLQAGKLLTIAAPAYPSYDDSPTAEFTMLASVQGKLDQINVMTYDLSGPYEGWVTWFNSPIYDGGYTFPSDPAELVPSVQGAVNNFTDNGVAPAKLGVGLPFYGYIWTGGPGVTQPRQSWPVANPPTVSTPSYSTIMSGYYQTNLYHWDTNAQAAYLGVTNTPAANDLFISYDDPRACQCKVSYVRNRGLGGIMIWELAQDYVPGQPAPLVQAIKGALCAPGQVSLARTNNDASLAFNGIALGSYRVEWASNLLDSLWNTLLITNVPAAGGLLRVTDHGVFTNQPLRFYRVQSPP
jgi:chitinase